MGSGHWLHAEKSAAGFISVADRKWAKLMVYVPLLEVERVAVEVSEHVVLKHLLVAVQRELLAAHGADLPVALHVLLKLALVVVGGEDDLAERTALHLHAACARTKHSSQVMMWPMWSNKWHLYHATWVGCCCCTKPPPTKGFCAAEQTLHRYRVWRWQQNWTVSVC